MFAVASVTANRTTIPSIVFATIIMLLGFPIVIRDCDISFALLRSRTVSAARNLVDPSGLASVNSISGLDMESSIFLWTKLTDYKTLESW